jgi:hypothetical protein
MLLANHGPRRCILLLRGVSTRPLDTAPIDKIQSAFGLDL